MAENKRLYALTTVIVVGICAIGVISWAIPVHDGWKPSDVTTLIASLTTFLGTIVGTFAGLQFGSAERHRIELLLRRALAALPPDEVKRLMMGD
jgi:hypothetical protein